MLTVGYATQDRSLSNPENLGGAGHYRCAVPAEALAAAGHDVRIGMLVSLKDGPLGLIPAADAQLEQRSDRLAKFWVPDIVVLQRYMHDGIPDAIRRARADGQIVVNDVDDLMWNVPVTNQAWRATHPNVHPTENVNHYRKGLAASSVITVSTPYLAESVRRFVHDAEIVVVRNAIDLARWATHPHYEPPRLGWTGVLTHRANDVEVVAGGLGCFVGNGYADQFVHVGSLGDGNPRIWDAAGLDRDRCVEHPMVPVDEWPNQLRHFDVGIVPLSGHNFNRAKSCIKGMEYAAAGVPFVASATPEYVWLHAEHEIGRLAPRGKHWSASLRALVDPEVRQAEAMRQRAAVAALDIANRWKEWEDVYAGASA